MGFFLKAKSWQLFLIFMVVMLSQPLFMVMLSNPKIAIGISTAFFTLVLVGWLWSIGIASNNLLPDPLKKSTRLYSSGLVFASLYALLFGFVLSPAKGFPAYIIPLHLLSMCFMFYALWFTAKQFTTLQRQETVNFFEFSGPFFMLWFFPIGVWFMQPRVNKLLGEKNA